MNGDINPTVHTAGLAALEATINRALTLAPGSADALAPLAEKVFALHCQLSKSYQYHGDFLALI